MVAILMADANFKVERGEFITTFFTEKDNKEELTVSIQCDNKKIVSNEEKLLQFCSVERTREEIIEYMGFSRYYTCSVIMKPLIEANKLALIIPDKPKSKKQKYIAI